MYFFKQNIKLLFVFFNIICDNIMLERKAGIKVVVFLYVKASYTDCLEKLPLNPICFQIT